MPDVKCPMCSKPNPEDAEECEFCGARIKPLIIQQPPDEPRISRPLEQPATGEDQPVPVSQEEPGEGDWLSQFRDEMDSEDEPAPQVEQGDAPKYTDMLGRLRIFGGKDKQEPDAPQPEEPADVPAVEYDDLQADAPEAAPEEFITPEPVEEPEPDFPLQSQPLSGLPEDFQPFVFDEPPSDEQQDEDVPGWLARVRAKKAHDELAEEEESLDQTDWLEKLREAQPSSSLETIEVSRDMIPSEEPAPPFIPLDDEQRQDEEDQGGDLFSGLIDEDDAYATLDDLFADYEEIDQEEDDQGGSELFAGVDAGVPTAGGKSPEEELFERLESEISSHEFKSEDLEPVEKVSTAPETWEQLEKEPIDHVLADAGDDLFADSAESLDEDLLVGDAPLDGLAPTPLEEDQPEELEAAPAQPPFILDHELDEWEDIDSQLLADLDRELESFGIEDDSLLPDETESESPVPDLPSLDVLEPEAAQADLSVEDGLGTPIPEELQESAPAFDDAEVPEQSLEEGEGPGQESEFPHVPALVIDDFGDEVSFDDGDFRDVERVLTQGEIPDWLQQLKSEAEFEPDDLDMEPEEDVVELVPAKLPDWLESMRPIQTFRSVSEVHETEKDIVEAAGPLAGLKGVLIAEPVVAMPRTPTRTRSSLDIHDEHFQQAEILQGLIEREAEGVKVEERSRPVAVLRWIVALVMLSAVILPAIFGKPSFEVPINGPRDLAQFLDLTRLLSAEDPVLLVFDYETANAAEMEAMAGAMMHHMMLRGQPLIAMSTQPSGPYLADRLFRKVGASHDVRRGEDYVNLGYLAGGPTAVQLFASAPREALMTSFRPEETNEDDTGWDTGPARGIEQLSDFSMVIVMTAGSQNSRMWAEQSSVYMGDTPLVMLISAGAEPMIRPYYEGRDPSVSAVLSGLGTAVKYEDEIGKSGDALARWDSYGLGVLAAALILLVGSVRAMVGAIPRPGKSKETGGEK